MIDKPTTAQRRVLLNLLAGRKAASGVTGLWNPGFNANTMHAMNKRGWMTWDGQLTGIGRELAERVRDNAKE